MAKARVIAIIPARYASERLPGKPLALIIGVPMVVHVARRAKAARSVLEAVVATDDERIRTAVEEHGFRAVMTDADLASGTDRVAAVARGIDAEIFVNVQGDEPLIEPEVIDAVADALIQDPDSRMSTAKTPITDADDLWNPTVAKVVCDANDRALYFSRAPIPFVRDAMNLDRAGAIIPDILRHRLFKHVGIYGYRRDFLFEFAAMPPGHLEQAEKLEQLRALEAGVAIVTPTVQTRSIGVDTPRDLARVRKLMERIEAGAS
ncbi:3-deoxy-manno-octulosonate cytidylyltransferase [bacterium]|nr:3-deoxy-manno-octulosonate cytidylyltransferase [bacterium]